MERPKYENNLPIRRKALGLTQKEIASYLGLKNSSEISRWEKGKRIPSLKNAIGLAIILNSTVEELFPGLFKTQEKIVKRTARTKKDETKKE